MSMVDPRRSAAAKKGWETRRRNGNAPKAHKAQPKPSREMLEARERVAAKRAARKPAQQYIDRAPKTDDPEELERYWRGVAGRAGARGDQETREKAHNLANRYALQPFLARERELESERNTVVERKLHTHQHGAVERLNRQIQRIDAKLAAVRKDIRKREGWNTLILGQRRRA